MIDQEVKNGIPSHRIILGGFSQVTIYVFDIERLSNFSDSYLVLIKKNGTIRIKNNF